MVSHPVRKLFSCVLTLVTLAVVGSFKSYAQTIEFESKGLHYQALTKSGVTVTFAVLPSHVKNFNIIQATVTNGSPVSWTVKPQDFTFYQHDGDVIRAAPADYVVDSLLHKASKSDVIRLQLIYESSIYSLSNFRATNGSEQRRQAAMAQFVNPRFKAAAAASVVTMVAAKLKPGDSTDGAVFFENKNKEKDKELGAGRLVVTTAGENFEFTSDAPVRLR